VFAVRAVDEALPRDEVLAVRTFVVTLVAVAFVSIALVEYRVVAVRAEEEALPSVVCPDTVKVLVVRAPVKDAVLP
jgi:hypothetical protein